jgi:hypothetical protein
LGGEGPQQTSDGSVVRIPGWAMLRGDLAGQSPIRVHPPIGGQAFR